MSQSPELLERRSFGPRQPANHLPQDPGIMKPETGRWCTALAYLLIIGGIVLRLIQYLTNRSLWHDEAMLAVNLVERSYLELLLPLSHRQVAPFGFLLVERFAISLFGSNEYVLRLLPFLAGCAAIFLFWSIARSVMAPAAALTALALFAINQNLIYYASEVKQYSTDVFIACLLLLIVVRVLQEGATRRRLLLLGSIGAAAVWFSQPSVFIMTGLAVGLSAGAVAKRNWAALRDHSIAYGVWVASVVPAVVLARRAVSAETMQFQLAFWRGGFMPLPPTTLADIVWFGKAGHEIFRYLLGFPVAPYACAIFAIGCVWGYRYQRDVLLCLLVPGVAVLLASGLQLYPARTRLLLFLVPALLIVIGAGATYLGDRVLRGAVVLRGAIVAALVLPALFLTVARLPIYRGHIRPVLQHVVEHRAAGEMLYVYHGAGKVMLYYAPRYRLGPSDYRIGTRARGEPHVYRAELDGYRGRGRVWFLFANASSREGREEKKLFLDHLQEIGTRVVAVESRGAAAYLYHLP